MPLPTTTSHRGILRPAASPFTLDQAHFIHDFGALVGCSPAEYAAACASVRAVA